MGYPICYRRPDKGLIRFDQAAKKKIFLVHAGCGWLFCLGYERSTENGSDYGERPIAVKKRPPITGEPLDII